jgi:hypothetical protein
MLQKLHITAVMLLVCALIGTGAKAQEAIGSVTRIQGLASRTAVGATTSLAVNTPVFLQDIVRTGETARLEITFNDATQLTLGEKAELALDKFVFNPAARQGSVDFAVRGAFRFLSGQVSKLASSQVNVRTPVATIGIRGTDFWGGPIDDQILGVFLVEGAVSVSNAAGAQILSQPGEGTNVPAAGAPPGPVTTWPADKVNRAVATVTFQ